MSNKFVSIDDNEQLWEEAECANIRGVCKTIIEKSSDVFSILKSNGEIKYISTAVEKLIGYDIRELVGKNVFDFYLNGNRNRLEKILDLALKYPKREIMGDIVFKHKNGQEINLEVHMQNLLNDNSINGILVNFRDINRRKRIEKRMAYLTTHDELTGLPNDIFFRRKLGNCCKNAEREKKDFALMMLNIEGLEYAKYSLGYEAGNKVIIEVVKRLKGFIREEIFLSRISDNHFAIIIEDLKSFGDYEEVIKKIIKLFEKSFIIDRYEVDISVYIGICFCPKDGENAEDIKNKANIALIRARKEGKNSYRFYSSKLDIKNNRELHLRNDLHKSIENNQLQAYYQPIIKLANDEIIAAESLIRWKHPEFGIISPNEFLPIAEENGFINNIGNWILREACKNYKDWAVKGHKNIKISINVSPIEFFQRNYAEKIIDTINEFELSPSFLILEITEGVLMENTDKAIDDINKLRSLGIKVALDDFGTGFSSLAYLKALNVDIIKLDRSFIQNALSDRTSNIITKTVIELARDLKLKLVAEGIENYQQFLYLRELKCYSGQGYLYGRPLPASEFEKALRIGNMELINKKVESPIFLK